MVVPTTKVNLSNSASLTTATHTTSFLGVGAAPTTLMSAEISLDVTTSSIQEENTILENELTDRLLLTEQAKDNLKKMINIWIDGKITVAIRKPASLEETTKAPLWKSIAKEMVTIRASFPFIEQSHPLAIWLYIHENPTLKKNLEAILKQDEQWEIVCREKLAFLIEAVGLKAKLNSPWKMLLGIFVSSMKECMEPNILETEAFLEKIPEAIKQTIVLCIQENRFEDLFNLLVS